MVGYKAISFGHKGEGDPQAALLNYGVGLAGSTAMRLVIAWLKTSRMNTAKPPACAISIQAKFAAVNRFKAKPRPMPMNGVISGRTSVGILGTSFQMPVTIRGVMPAMANVQ